MIHKTLSCLSLSNVVIYLKNGTPESDKGTVNLHPSKRTHWVAYINQNYFDPYGCSPPQKLSRFIVKRNGNCLLSEYKIQSVTNNRVFYCAAFSYIYILLDHCLRNRF